MSTFGLHVFGIAWVSYDGYAAFISQPILFLSQ